MALIFLRAPPARAAVDTNSPELSWYRDALKTHDDRLEWWRNGRFGMFVHWGVYSGLGGTFQGQTVKGYAEHIQRRLKIPIPVYREQVAGKFDPVQFNADEWIRAARDAGMAYFIITAKHHDGFAMWDSKVSDYNIVKATPFKRDPMKELRVACKKYGIKFGFYYSHAFDWGDANAPGNDWDYQNPGGDLGLHGGRDWWVSSPELLPQVRNYVDQKSIPQILELIRNYDPDILWFDTPGKLPPEENLRILKTVRQAKPNVVINGRLVHGMGDYDSTTDRPAEFTPHAGDWEGIPTTNESYGWNQNDDSHKPPSHFIRLLAKAAARGGNLLLNIGPMGDGKMDPKDVAILQGIGAWWKVNGESIRGTTRTPLAVQAWGESTVKGRTLYLHVFDWPSARPLVVGGLKSEVVRAYLLADAKAAPLKTSRLNSLDVSISIPPNAPDNVDSVITVECDSDVVADSTRLLLSNFPVQTLRVFDGELHGKLRFGPGKKTDAYLQYWSNMLDSISWAVRLDRPASFELAAICDADTASEGSTFAVRAGEQQIQARVTPGHEKEIAVGRLQLAAGPAVIKVTPVTINGRELMRLRSLRLTPISQK